MSNKYDHDFLKEVRDYIESANKSRGPYGLQIVLEKDAQSSKFNPKYNVMIYVEDAKGTRMWQAMKEPLPLYKNVTVHLANLSESFVCTFS
jgi:hypothetical protein